MGGRCVGACVRVWGVGDPGSWGSVSLHAAPQHCWSPNSAFCPANPLGMEGTSPLFSGRFPPFWGHRAHGEYKRCFLK